MYMYVSLHSFYYMFSCHHARFAGVGAVIAAWSKGDDFYWFDAVCAGIHSAVHGYVILDCVPFLRHRGGYVHDTYGGFIAQYDKVCYGMYMYCSCYFAVQITSVGTHSIACTVLNRTRILCRIKEIDDQ